MLRLHPLPSSVSTRELTLHLNLWLKISSFNQRANRRLFQPGLKQIQNRSALTRAWIAHQRGAKSARRRSWAHFRSDRHNAVWLISLSYCSHFYSYFYFYCSTSSAKDTALLCTKFPNIYMYKQKIQASLLLTNDLLVPFFIL